MKSRMSKNRTRHSSNGTLLFMHCLESLSNSSSNPEPAGGKALAADEYRAHVGSRENPVIFKARDADELECLDEEVVWSTLDDRH